MKIAVIIPVLNESNLIETCLTALQSCRHQCEIIVVDGGSTDGTVKIAKPLSDQVIASAKGRAKQMNAGAAQTQAEMLLFLHADTFLPDNALAKLSGLTHHWGRFDIHLISSLKMLKIVSALMNWRSRITGISTGDQAIFVSRALFDAVGGYSDIALMEDINLCHKLKKIKRPINLGVKVRSSGRRWEQFGVLKTILLMWSLRLRYFLGEKPEILSLLYSKGLLWKP
jgi:rSAM/selenodomain-associated transferase 2